MSKVQWYRKRKTPREDWQRACILEALDFWHGPFLEILSLGGIYTIGPITLRKKEEPKRLLGGTIFLSLFSCPPFSCQHLWHYFEGKNGPSLPKRSHFPKQLPRGTFLAPPFLWVQESSHSHFYQRYINVKLCVTGLLSIKCCHQCSIAIAGDSAAAVVRPCMMPSSAGTAGSIPIPILHARDWSIPAVLIPILILQRLVTL